MIQKYPNMIDLPGVLRKRKKTIFLGGCILISAKRGAAMR
jgi:hypothetical protein